jgi:adenosylcobinamide-phosphate synthase
MGLESQIMAAVFLDLLFGDPRWLPHPVRLIGNLALRLEPPVRGMISDARYAGVAVVVLVVGITALATAGLIVGSRLLHPWLGDLVAVLLIYFGIAVRDMLDHSCRVYEALASGSLAAARSAVAMICGRDTDRLDEAAAARAAVESVAENLVDGVTAPLFYCVLGGPVAMMAYKAVNTLDSTFGYKNDRYAQFGWASARLDDLANFIPARLTAVIVPVAAWLLGQSASRSWRVFLRDRGKHPSPNAGQTEAALAGALGLQLGGLSYYFGQPSEKPRLGDPVEPLVAEHITRANALFVATAGLFLGGLLLVRSLIL